MPSKNNAFWHASVSKGWSIQAPPALPSKSEVKILENFIKLKNLGQNLLVLGATPEYRNLAHRLKKQVTLCDISFEMMLEMSNHLRYPQNAKKEIWLKSDWLSAPLQENYFDIILGDFVIANVPCKQQNNFYKNIASFLSKNGYFLTRIYYPPYPIQKLSDLFSAYLKNKLTDNALYFGLLGASFNPKNYTVSTLKTRRLFKKYLVQTRGREKIKLQKHRKIFQSFYTSSKVWWPTPRPICERMLRRYFRIEKIESGNDHYFTKDCPIYFLRKK